MISFRKKTAILFLLFALAVILGLRGGAVNIPWDQVFAPQNSVILHMRILRILTACLAGCGLAVSGIALQAVLRNPLAEPYLLGTSSGAGLAAVVALILGCSRFYAPFAAFLGALGSIFFVYMIARDRNHLENRSLILSGVILSMAFSAGIVFLISISPQVTIQEITWWLWGSLQAYDPFLVLIVSIFVLAGIAVIYIFAQDLNAMSLGDEEAVHLGIHPQNTKKIIMAVAALITASLISLCGMIGFVGLIIPHAMRFLVGPDHKILIPVSCLSACIFMISCDLISRAILPPFEIPIGVVTALIGAPIFIFLMKREKRS